MLIQFHIFYLLRHNIFQMWPHLFVYSIFVCHYDRNSQFISIIAYKYMSTRNSQPRPLIIKEINLAREINFLQNRRHSEIKFCFRKKQREKSMEMVFKKEYLKLARGVVKFKTNFFFKLHCCRSQKACTIGRIKLALIGYCFKVGVSFG